MSNPIQSVPTPTGEFQSHFGSPPGSSDLAAECKKWERLCGELLAEREKMRADATAMRSEFVLCKKSLYRLVFQGDEQDFDLDVALAHLDDKPTLEDLIAQLAQAPG